MAELDRLKNNFIAIASHELRTPLGVIMGYASFLQMEESTSAQENASKVMESALKLRKIIEDMVNLRYLKQKPKDLFLEETTAGALFHHFEREAQTLLDSRQHVIQILPPDPDLPIRVDTTRMLMVLTNLLNNAMTFTDAGGRITLKAQRGDGRSVELLMTDTGLGLPADKLEKIFEEFYQIEDHMTRRHGGLGIGLSIARAILDAHQGTITAASEGLGHGATFTIRLPMPV
jgi:signal transduction histidine kinase